MTREATPWARLQCRCFLPIAFRFQEPIGSYFNIVIKSRNAICFVKINAKVIALLLVMKSPARADCRSAQRSVRQQVNDLFSVLCRYLER